jgi:hypothetical protein
MDLTVMAHGHAKKAEYKGFDITTCNVPVRTLTELSDSAELLSDVKHVLETRGSEPQQP